MTVAKPPFPPKKDMKAKAGKGKAPAAKGKFTPFSPGFKAGGKVKC